MKDDIRRGGRGTAVLVHHSGGLGKQRLVCVEEEGARWLLGGVDM